MGPWFLNTMWFTSMAALTIPESVEPGRKREDPSFREGVPTSASSEACWKTKVLPRASEDQWMDSLLACKQPGADQIGVQCQGGLCQAWEKNRPHPRLRADLETQCTEWTLNPAQQNSSCILSSERLEGAGESKNKDSRRKSDQSNGPGRFPEPRTWARTPSTKQPYRSFPRYVVRTSHVPGTAPTTGDFKSKQRRQPALVELVMVDGDGGEGWEFQVENNHGSKWTA